MENQLEAQLTNIREGDYQCVSYQSQVTSASDWTVDVGRSQLNNTVSCGGTSHLQLSFNRYEVAVSVLVRVFVLESGIWDELTNKQSALVHFFWDSVDRSLKLISTNGVHMLINRFVMTRSISLLQRSKNFVQFDCDSSVSTTVYGFGFDCTEDIGPFMVSVKRVLTNLSETSPYHAWSVQFSSSIPWSTDNSALNYMRDMRQSALPPAYPEKMNHGCRTSAVTHSSGCSHNNLSPSAATIPHCAVTPTKPPIVPSCRGSLFTTPYSPLAGLDNSVTTCMAASTFVSGTPIKTTPPVKQYFDDTSSPRIPWQMSHADTAPNESAPRNSGLLNKPAPIPLFPSKSPVTAQTSSLFAGMIRSSHMATFAHEIDWSYTKWPSQVSLVDDMPQGAKGSLHLSEDLAKEESAGISDPSTHATLQRGGTDETKSMCNNPFSADNGLFSSILSLNSGTSESHYKTPSRASVDVNYFEWEMLSTTSGDSRSLHTPPTGSPLKHPVMDPIGTPRSGEARRAKAETATRNIPKEAQKGSTGDVLDVMAGLEEALLGLNFTGLSSPVEDDEAFGAGDDHR